MSARLLGFLVTCGSLTLLWVATLLMPDSTQAQVRVAASDVIAMDPKDKTTPTNTPAPTQTPPPTRPPAPTDTLAPIATATRTPPSPTPQPTRPPTTNPAPPTPSSTPVVAVPTPTRVPPTPTAAAPVIPPTPRPTSPPPSSSGSTSRPRATPTPTPEGLATPTPGPPKQTFAPPAAQAPAPPPIPTSTPIPAAEPVIFALGVEFGDLQLALGAVMGDPIEDERTIQNSDGCEDHEQRTSLGLAYIQCGAGVPVFAADPDGLYHWAWLGDHLAAWIGVQIDPPLQAMDLPVCVGPAHDAETACPLRLDVPVAGFLAEPGQSDAYRFSVSDPSLDIAADLTDLPADYDLYLVDGEGAIRAQSAEDGTSPERVAQSLTQGTYYLYVHVDPGRAATPDQPYLLRLSLEPPPAVAAPANDALPDDQTDR